jgi:hypothetical protein
MLLASGMLVVCGIPAAAEMVQVTATGVVEFNLVNNGPMSNVNANDATTMTFMVDSDTFTNSGGFPTRGYAIDMASFTLTLGSESFGLQSPFPPGQTPYFVLRNNDPAVDGFFVSTSVDSPIGVPIDEVGQLGQFENNFSVTYQNDPLASLDILDAVGAYDLSGLSVFHWTIDDGPFEPVGLIFSTLTISAEAPVPALSPLALSALAGGLVLAGWLVARRRLSVASSC